MLDRIPSPYAFLIHTDSYAGNFERAMCAFITGEIGECGVGKDLIDEEVDYSTMDEIVAQYPDEHGCHRPVTMQRTPDQWRTNKKDEWECNTVAILLSDKPTLEQKKFMEKMAMEFPEAIAGRGGRYDSVKMKVLGMEWIETEHTYKEKRLEF